MLQIAKIKENPSEYAERLNLRGFDGKERVEALLLLDDKRRAGQQQKDDLLSQMNQLSASIGQLFKEGKQDLAEIKKGETTSIKEAIKIAEDELKEVEEHLVGLLNDTPNAPDSSVPVGNSEKDNIEIFSWGSKQA